MKRIQIYDTTLRDGSQAEDVSFTSDDKLKVCLKLDELGMDYIEGGWPGSNPTDDTFFQGNPQLQPEARQDRGLRQHPPPWPFGGQGPEPTGGPGEPGRPCDHPVRQDLGFARQGSPSVSLERNLELIYDSVAYLKPKTRGTHL